jgi:hypothetical protein
MLRKLIARPMIAGARLYDTCASAHTGSADFLLHFGIPTASDESLYCSDSEVAQNWQPTIVGCDGETIWWHSRSGARRYFRTILHARAAAAGLARSWLVGCSEGRCVLYR